MHTFLSRHKVVTSEAVEHKIRTDNAQRLHQPIIQDSFHSVDEELSNTRETVSPRGRQA